MDTSRIKPFPGKTDEKALDYKLVWSDEFERDGLPDPAKWRYDVGGGGWGNQELEYYQDSQAPVTTPNAFVKDGCLIIEARREKIKDNAYSSARLLSKGRGSWQYGRFEIRAKLPKGRGTWPAIWMLPTDWAYGGWPSSGEIDIMEHVGFDQDNIVGTVHCEAYNHIKHTEKGKTIHVPGVSEDFHVYAIEWLPEEIRFFVDGTCYFTFCPWELTKQVTYKEWPFDKPFHLLLNIAVGGSWGGRDGVDDTIFPQRMEVDYVRVYQAEKVTPKADES